MAKNFEQRAFCCKFCTFTFKIEAASDFST